METITKRLSQLDLSEAKEKKECNAASWLQEIHHIHCFFKSPLLEQGSAPPYLIKEHSEAPRRLVHGDGTQKW